MDNKYNPQDYNGSPSDAQLDELLASIKAQQSAYNAEKPAINEQLSAVTSAFFDDFPSSNYSAQNAPPSPYPNPNSYNAPPVQNNTYTGLPPVWDDVDLTTSEEISRNNDLTSFAEENPFGNGGDLSFGQGGFGGEAFPPANAQPYPQPQYNPYGAYQPQQFQEQPQQSYPLQPQPQYQPQPSYPQAAEAPAAEYEPTIDPAAFAGVFNAINGVNAQPSAVPPQSAEPGVNTNFAPTQATSQPSPVVFEQTPETQEPSPIAFEQTAKAEEPSRASFEQAPETQEPSPVAFEQASKAQEPLPVAFEQTAKAEEPIITENTAEPEKAFDGFDIFDDVPSSQSSSEDAPFTNDNSPYDTAAFRAAFSPAETQQSETEAPSLEKDDIVENEDSQEKPSLDETDNPYDYEETNEDEDEYQAPPYIAPRAVKRGTKGKKKTSSSSKKKGKSSTKVSAVAASGKTEGKKKGGKGVLIALACVVGVIVIAAAVFFPSLKFSISLLSGDYDAAGVQYASSVAPSSLQSLVGNKVAEYVVNKTVASYTDGSADYETVSAIFDKLSSMTALDAIVSAGRSTLDTQHTSNVAFDAANEALSADDFKTAVEQFMLVDPINANYTAAQTKLSDAKSSLKAQILENTSNNFAQGYYTATFTDYDIADALLANDSDIANQYATHEAAYVTYIVDLVKTYIMDSNYTDALSAINASTKLCHKSSELAALSEAYTGWISPINVFTLAASDEDGAADGNSETDWVSGSDSDNRGSFEYASGKIFKITTSDVFSKEYALDGQYEKLSGFFGAHGSSAAVTDPNCYGRLSIYGDGSLLYSSSSVNGASDPVAVDVDLSNIDTLTIRVDMKTTNSTELTLALMNFNLFKDMTELKATLTGQAPAAE